MKKSLLLVLSFLLCLTFPLLGMAQNENRTMLVHVKGAQDPLKFDVSTIDSISFADVENPLSFDFVVENIDLEGADLTILPSDQSMKYYANYAPSSEFVDKTDEEIIQLFLPTITEDYLLAGDFTVKAADITLLPDTEYTLFAFGYQNGRVNSAGLFKTKFRTLSERPTIPGPEVSLTGEVGDKSGNNKDSNLRFSMNCQAGNASYAECLISESQDIDSKLGEGFSLDQIVEGNRGSGYVLDNKEMAMFNGVGFDLELNSSDGVKPGTKYTCILLAENWEGGKTIVRQDVQTEETKEVNVKPEVVVEGWAGDPDGFFPSTDLTFKITCTTRNAAYAECFIMETNFVDNIGFTLEELVDFNAGGGRKMDIDELNQMNSDGVLSYWNGNNGDTSYALVVVVKNKHGERTIVRKDVSTKPDGTPFSTQSVKSDVKGKLSAGNAVWTNQNGKLKVNVLK